MSNVHERKYIENDLKSEFVSHLKRRARVQTIAEHQYVEYTTHSENNVEAKWYTWRPYGRNGLLLVVCLWLI